MYGAFGGVGVLVVALSIGHVHVADGGGGFLILRHSVDEEMLFLPLIQR